MKLLVNADDFGLSEAVNYGIVKGYTAGIVRSTTLMVNMSAVDHALELHRQHPGLGIGIHMTLTAGKPVLANSRTLTDDSGIFWKQLVLFEKLESGKIDVKEVEAEWKTQIEKARSLGFKITHLDSHHHVHLRPELVSTSFKLARDFNIPIRIGKEDAQKLSKNDAPRTTDHFSMDFYGEKLTPQSLIKLLEPYKNKAVSLELMSHPAYIDKTLALASGYTSARLDELEVLISNDVKEYIKKNNIELINFGSLA